MIHLCIMVSQWTGHPRAVTVSFEQTLKVYYICSWWTQRSSSKSHPSIQASQRGGCRCGVAINSSQLLPCCNSCSVLAVKQKSVTISKTAVVPVMQFLWTCSLQTLSGAVSTSTSGRDRPPPLLLLASTLPAAESTWLYWRPVECQSDCQVTITSTRRQSCLFFSHQWELFQLLVEFRKR